MTQVKVIKLKLDSVCTDNQVLSLMSQSLASSKIVKKSFEKAICKREEEFSTGLNIGQYGVAIPHTDIEHVNQSTLAVVTLENPVIFKQMGDNSEVQVNLVCMLALNESHAHLEMLQKLMELFQNEEVIKSIIELSDNEENRQKVIDIFKENHII